MGQSDRSWGAGHSRGPIATAGALHAAGPPGARLPPAGAAFFFDLACPFSYLAAERVERTLGAVEWVPVPGVGAPGWRAHARAAALEGAFAAELRAAELRLPLVWPSSYPSSVPWALARRGLCG